MILRELEDLAKFLAAIVLTYETQWHCVDERLQKKTERTVWQNKGKQERITKH